MDRRGNRFPSWVFLAAGTGLCVLIAGCMPGGGVNTPTAPAGFFMGIWHGWIAPFSVIVGFFNQAIRVYEPHNTGWWYDLGFYVAIISGFGGLSFVRRQNANSRVE